MNVLPSHYSNKESPICQSSRKRYRCKWKRHLPSSRCVGVSYFIFPITFFWFINIIIVLVSLCLWFHVIVCKTKYLFKTNSIHYIPKKYKDYKIFKIIFWLSREDFLGEAYSIFNYIHLPIHMSNRCLRNDLSLQNTVMEMETTTRYNSWRKSWNLESVFNISINKYMVNVSDILPWFYIHFTAWKQKLQPLDGDMEGNQRRSDHI